MQKKSDKKRNRPNPPAPEPKRLCGSIAEPFRNPPNPPLSKGGEGGFLEFVANLGANPFLKAYAFSATLRGKSGPCGGA
jgi:hypothetical protein